MYMVHIFSKYFLRLITALGDAYIFSKYFLMLITALGDAFIG